MEEEKDENKSSLFRILPMKRVTIYVRASFSGPKVYQLEVINPMTKSSDILEKIHRDLECKNYYKHPNCIMKFNSLSTENGLHMEDQFSIFQSMYNLKDQSLLNFKYLLASRDPGQESEKRLYIYVKDMEYREKVFNVSSTVTVKELKSRIFDWTDIPICQQTLSFNDIELKDYDKLTRCGDWFRFRYGINETCVHKNESKLFHT